jgi:ribulose-5-phosphate 4-epimerase/fuculose-1-phosphate aldolase
MSTQEPASAASVNSVAEAAERAHFAFRRAVVDVESLPCTPGAEEVPVAPSAGAIIGLIEARPGTQAVLLGDHGVLAVGPDTETETPVSLLVALEEAAEAELRAAALG